MIKVAHKGKSKNDPGQYIPVSWNALVLTVGFGLAVVQVNTCAIPDSHPDVVNAPIAVDTCYLRTDSSYAPSLVPSYEGFLR